ncbi:hypothetical protein GJAV_G00260170 [Gymnothorax javanicus]|nr:hypothetical protein GJAV_G00260170 [Gymnothorax javanicus]
MPGLGRNLFAVLKHSNSSFHGALFRGNGVRQIQTKLGKTRSLCLSSRRDRKSQTPEDDRDEDTENPIEFSTSKASHRVWRVDTSLGRSHERPWWKVLPLSLFGVCFLLWCIFRKESGIDRQLEKELDEYFPGIFSEEEDPEDHETRPNS